MGEQRRFRHGAVINKNTSIAGKFRLCLRLSLYYMHCIVMSKMTSN